MTLEIGFTDEMSNTQFAPLAILFAHYQQNQVLAPLTAVHTKMRQREFCSPRQTHPSVCEHFGGLRNPFARESTH
jgi:hypothetical protein